MKWRKMGLIFQSQNNYDWMVSHASIPTPTRISDAVVRIYFSTRSKSVRSAITFIDVEAANPSKVVYVHDRPVLSAGELGTFDDGGVGPYCVVDEGQRKYLYYGGWNAGVTVPYRNAIGLAVSEDNGLTFQRVCPGAVVDRNQTEPHFTTAADVMRMEGSWRMWYGSATGWVIVGGKPEPRYQIKYAESRDGITWDRPNITCIEYQAELEANARPCVIRDGDRYQMWYCYRGCLDYRTNRSESYRLGYAESTDGVKWTRKDDQVGIDRSESGWDSVMMCYPYVYQYGGNRYLLYNGNGFGESGFGYALLESD
jgi:hypothetical protein